MEPVTTHRVRDAWVTVIAGSEETPDRLVMPDIEVGLADGSRWSATIATLADIASVMDKCRRTGEDLSGRFFSCPDLLVVRESTLGEILAVVDELIEAGEIGSALQQLGSGASLPKSVFVDLALTLEWPVLIVEASTGVVYSNQVYGTSALHPELEGWLMPLPDQTRRLPGLLDDHFQAEPYSLTGADRTRGTGITEATADWLDEVVLPNCARVDRERLDDSREAWVYLRVASESEDFPLWVLDRPRRGVLTWPNSD